MLLTDCAQRRLGDWCYHAVLALWQSRANEDVMMCNPLCKFSRRKQGNKVKATNSITLLLSLSTEGYKNDAATETIKTARDRLNCNPCTSTCVHQSLCFVVMSSRYWFMTWIRSEKAQRCTLSGSIGMNRRGLPEATNFSANLNNQTSSIKHDLCHFVNYSSIGQQ